MRGRAFLISVATLLSSAMIAPTSAQDQHRAAQQIRFSPYDWTDSRGQKVDAEIGKLRVPENRAKSRSAQIELTVVRLKTGSSNPGPPVLYLAGGPGSSAIGEGQFPFMKPLVDRLLENHDVILMDQRGTGSSSPPVLWLSPSPLPTDVFESESRMVEVIREGMAKAIESFKKRGIDLTGYSTVESADDLNDLREALGLTKMSLLGFSYGTHFALATIRRHAAHLDSVVLVGTEGPNHTLKLPSVYDAQLRKLSDLAAADPNVAGKVPDMVSLLRRVLDNLDRKPVRVQIRSQRAGELVEVPVGRFALQLLVRMDVGDGNDFPEFPLLFYTIDRGDYSILRKYVAKRYNQFSRGLSGMTAMMDLYSGATAERVARIRREAATAILGNAMNFPDMYVADLWGNPDLGDDYRGPLLSSTRTLFISGTLDSNTPPYQAEEIRWGFVNGAHLVVEYAGHEDMLPQVKVQSAIVDFLNGKDVSQTRISLGRPRFKAIP